MTAKVTVAYPVPASDMPLVQFLAGASGTAPPGPGGSTDVPGSAQYLINGVVSGPSLIDFQSRLWSLTAGPPPDVLLNGFGNWTATNAGDPPTQLLLASDHNVYMLPAIGIWKHYDSDGTWRNGTPPTATQPPPALPALPTPNPIAPGSSGKTITCGTGQTIPTLSAAQAAAVAGDTIQVVPATPPVTYTDVLKAIGVPLLIKLGGNKWDLTGQDASLPFSGAGFLVIADGADTIIDGEGGSITGVGMSKSTGDNTSAVRAETAYVTVKNLELFGNQCGVGTGDPNSVIELDGCNIHNNGLLVNSGGSLTHNIYVNSRRLTLTNTNSTASIEGYAVKSRGPELIINGGTFSSSPNAKPFDLPNGTTVPFTMTGATILKGAADGDHGILSYGEEGASNGTAGGTISGGSIAALCQNPVISAPNGGTVTLSGVAMSGNPITGNPLSAVVIK